MLNSNKVRANEGDVVHLAEHSDHTGMIDAGDQHTQKIGQQRWLFLEVERQSLVVAGHKIVSCDQVRHHRGSSYISTLATRTITSLNWLCSQASADLSIIARAALS